MTRPSLLLIPFGLLLCLPFWHSHDLRIFQSWCQASQLGWSDLYLNAPRCNYPCIGAGFAAPGMRLDGLAPQPFWVFRGLLATLSVANSLLMWRMLLWLKVTGADRKVVLTALLPSTWVLEYLWGNLEGLVQFDLWLCLASLSACYLGRAPRLAAYFVGTLALCALPLIKQTGAFSWPALALFWGLVSYDLGLLKGRTLLVAALATLPLWLADICFRLPPGYVTHLQSTACLFCPYYRIFAAHRYPPYWQLSTCFCWLDCG